MSVRILNFTVLAKFVRILWVASFVVSIKVVNWPNKPLPSLFKKNSFQSANLDLKSLGGIPIPTMQSTPLARISTNAHPKMHATLSLVVIIPPVAILVVVETDMKVILTVLKYSMNRMNFIFFST